MKFVLIRHSKTERNPEVPILCWGLSENGIELAHKLSQENIIKKLEVVYSSLQTKALETAVLICKPNAIPIKTDDRLTEDTSFTGPFEMDGEVYTKNIHDYYFGNLERIKGGETKGEALIRFEIALESISKIEGQHSYVGIVSHGNILALFSEKYSGISSFELHTKIKQPDVAVFDFTEKKFISFFSE